jgi:transporter family protein
MSKYILIAIISSVLFGITTIVQKKAIGVDPVTFVLLSMASGTVVTFLYWYFAAGARVYSAKGIWYGLIAGVMSAAAFLMFILALRNSKVSPIVVINTFSAAIAVILSVILLKEKLSVTQILGVIMGISGVVLVSL